MKYFVVIDEKDNVATAVRDAGKGEEVETNLQHKLKLLDPIKKGHKVAIKDIKAHQPVIKYGETICLAKRDIKIGEHIHVHNIIDILTQRVEDWKKHGV